MNSIEPQQEPFPAIFGQLHPRQVLARILMTGRVGHSYLLLGSEGCGTLPLALELARVLNCPKDPRESVYGCDCRSCQQIRRWEHPNVLPVFPLPPIEKDKGKAAQKALDDILAALRGSVYAPLKFTGTGRILIDQIREVRNSLSLTLDRDGVRCVIVHPAERMNDAAANSLLKLLEEPPERCCLILTAENTRDLLPTVVSRCQPLALSELSPADIEQGLTRNFSIPPERARTVAHLADGSLTQALELAGEDTMSRLNKALDFLRFAATDNRHEIKKFVDVELHDDPRGDAIRYLRYLSIWLKDAAVSGAFGADSATGHLATAHQPQAVSKMGQRYGPERLTGALCECEEARLAIESNANSGLVFYALAVKIGRLLS